MAPHFFGWQVESSLHSIASASSHTFPLRPNFTQPSKIGAEGKRAERANCVSINIKEIFMHVAITQ